MQTTLRKHKFSIGDIECHLLLDGENEVDASRLAKGVEPAEIARALNHPDLTSPKYTLAYTPVLLECAGQWVLIDAGVGEDTEPGFGHVQKHLRAFGLAPGDISTVVLTHAHTDHFGGLTLHGAAAFPSAKVLIQHIEWDWATSPERLASMDAERKQDLLDNFVSRKAQMTFVEGDVALAQGLRAMHSPGHTPGHMCVIAESRGQSVVFAADLLLHPIHATHPEWAFVNDVSPDQTVASRRRVLAWADAHNALVTAYHFPFPTVLQPRNIA